MLATEDILSQLHTYQNEEKSGNNSISLGIDNEEEGDNNGILSPTKIIISEQQHKVLEHLTMNYLGPMAKLIVEKLLYQVTDAQILIQLLSQRIPDPEEAQTFEKQVEQLLL